MESYSYTIVSDVCEGVGDCVGICPVEAIHWAPPAQRNAKGTSFAFIDEATCIVCGGCLSVCPIEGAILPEWRPELQKANL